MKDQKLYLTLSVAEAIALAERRGISVTPPTIAAWCRQYGIGYQLGGRHGKWRVVKDRLNEFLSSGANHGNKARK